MFQAQGAERASGYPPPPSRMQKAICYNSDRLASPAWEMDVAFWNLYHPKGKCLLNHREPGESRGRRCRGLVTLQRQGPKGGDHPGARDLPLPCMPWLPFFGESLRQEEREMEVPVRLGRSAGCVPALAHPCVHTHVHTRAHANPVHPQVLLKPLPAPSLPCSWPPPSPPGQLPGSTSDQIKSHVSLLPPTHPTPILKGGQWSSGFGIKMKWLTTAWAALHAQPRRLRYTRPVLPTQAALWPSFFTGFWGSFLSTPPWLR